MNADHRMPLPWALGLALALTFAALSSRCMARDPDVDVPYEPTPTEVVERVHELAGTGPGDVVYDLGSGDGRFVISAVRDFDASRAVGIEIQSHLVERARANARAAGVSERVRFIRGDLFEADFSAATVVTLYLWPQVNMDLRPRLFEQLAPGTRVVSYSHDMDDWQPDATVNVGRPIYLWIIPADLEGRWRLRLAGERHRLQIDQYLQRISGTLGEAAVLADTAVRGAQVRFTAAVDGRALRFVGRAAGPDRLEGHVRIDGQRRPWNAVRMQ